MIEGVIMALIYLCLIVLAYYVILYVLETIGLTIPPQILKIVWLILVLVAILVLVKAILPGLGFHLGGRVMLEQHYALAALV